jgi:hypothetical protein
MVIAEGGRVGVSLLAVRMNRILDVETLTFSWEPVPVESSESYRINKRETRRWYALFHPLTCVSFWAMSKLDESNSSSSLLLFIREKPKLDDVPKLQGHVMSCHVDRSGQSWMELGLTSEKSWWSTTSGQSKGTLVT